MWVLGRANPWLGVVRGDAPHTAMLPDLGLRGKLGPGVDDDRVTLGPPRSGKTFRLLVSILKDHPGSAVVTSTKVDSAIRVTMP